MRGAQINHRRPLNIFEIFCYQKGICLVKYQIKISMKILAKTYTKHTLRKHDLGQDWVKYI